MVTSSIATLAPPYFTRSLLNNVLIPAHHVPGSVSFNRVWLFLFAFVGASVLAWLLSWGRTYVMAWVSERIAVRSAQSAPTPICSGCRWNFSAASGPAT